MTTKKSRTLELLFLKEVNDGKKTFETRRFRNLKVDALEEDLLALADAIINISEGSFEVYQLSEQSILSK